MAGVLCKGLTRAITRSALTNNSQSQILQTNKMLPVKLSALKTGSFEILEEKVVHKRYLTVYDRLIRYPSQQQNEQHKFDVVGHPQSEFQFSVVCPVRIVKDNSNKSELVFTLVYEYCQGINKQAFCLPTGGFHPGRHSNLEECAKAELSEEAGLTGGKIVRLLAENHEGFAEVKWCRNRFVPFVVINPERDVNPGKRDVEEQLIQIVEVSLEELEQLMVGGEMMLPSVTTCFIALNYLRNNGYLQRKDLQN